MTSDQMHQLGNALDQLALGYTEAPLSPDRKRLYCQVLSGVSFDMALYACEAWLLGESPFFPTPGQLYTLATTLPHTAQGTAALQERAMQAWGNLRSSRTHFNAWALEDTITRQVFRVMGGGYRTECGFGMWAMRYEENKRREFCTIYVDLARQAENLPPLPTAPLALPQPILADYDDNPEDQQYVAETIAPLLADLAAKLAMPPAGAPPRYLREPSKHGDRYTSPLTAEELAARRALLLRQANQLLSQELAKIS